MTELEQARDHGRFQKGVSGNPNGRSPGARTKAALAAEELLEGEAERLTRKAIERALSGDGTALRLCLERVVPPRRSSRVRLSLPALATLPDLATASGVVMSAMAAGELTLDEAAAIAGLLKGHRDAVAAVELEDRVAELERLCAEGRR